MKKLFCLLLVLAASSSWAGSDAKHFEKLDITGKILPVEATEWAMVTDKARASHGR